MLAKKNKDPTTKKQQRVVGYVRVSSAKQLEEGFSYDSQIKMVKQHAKEKEYDWQKGLGDRGYYSDGGRTGSTSIQLPLCSISSFSSKGVANPY